MAEEQVFEATNFNTLWLQNIYENIKHIEQLQRLSQEGIIELVEYVQVPIGDRAIQIPLLQYKNLRILITEMELLLVDLIPTVKEDFFEEKKKIINTMQSYIDYEDLFYERINDYQKKRIIEIRLKPLFYKSLEIIGEMKADIIREIKHLLFIEKGEKGFGLEKAKKGILVQ